MSTPREQGPDATPETAQDELARSNARLRVLAEASHEFARPSDYAALLATVVRSIAREIGDACSITLLDASGETLTGAASSHSDPALDEDFRRLLVGVAIPKQSGESVVAAVTRSGVPNCVPVVRPESLVERTTPDLKPLVARLNVHSFLCVPVRARENILGAITLMRSGPGRSYTADDLTLLTEVADRAGLAIHNAHLLEEARARSAELAAANTTLRQHAAMVDGISEAVIALDPQLRVRSWNRGACLLYGWTFEEALGKDLVELLARERRDPSRTAAFQQLKREGRWSGERLQRRKDGSLVEAHVSASALRDQGDELFGMLLIARDLSDERNAERAVRQLASIVESSTDAIISCTLEGIVQTWNDGAQRLFGYTPDEIVGKSFALLVPDDRRSEISKLQEIRQGVRSITFETVRQRKDGSRVDVSITLSGIASSDGKTVAVSSIVRDMTERRKLEQQVVLSERLASVGMLAAGVAHEINNPLSYVLGNLELLLRQIPELKRALPERMHGSVTQLLEDARDGTERIARIVQGLQTFSRAERAPLARLSLAPVVEKAVGLTQNELKHRATLTKQYAATPAVMGDEGRLVQVFVNLLVNAAHALSDAGNGEIRLSMRTDARGWAAIEVQDSGRGIPDAVREYVFDAFFTTKPVGAGTGLGLSISRNIVQAHGGEIDFESKPGVGTTFRVSLPPAAQEALPASQQPPAEPARTGSRRARVVVVDDEPMIGRLLSAVLEKEHEVTVYVGGHELLQRVRAGERFDAILCDLMMPGLTGMDIHAEMERIAPEQAERMIFITGGAFTAASKAFLERVPNARLDKPFSTAKVRALSARLALGGRLSE